MPCSLLSNIAGVKLVEMVEMGEMVEMVKMVIGSVSIRLLRNSVAVEEVAAKLEEVLWQPPNIDLASFALRHTTAPSINRLPWDQASILLMIFYTLCLVGYITLHMAHIIGVAVGSDESLGKAIWKCGKEFSRSFRVRCCFSRCLFQSCKSAGW